MRIMPHIPVLLNEVIEYLQPKNGKRFIDATVNGGGHAKEILRHLPKDGILIGIDRDKNILECTAQQFEEDKRFKPIHGNFKDIAKLTRKYARSWDGILFDLGMSSLQLGKSGRGFSFMKNEPLDMRFDASQTLNAAQVVNQWPEHELVDAFSKYGEERYAKRIARAICESRRKIPVKTTTDLVNIIRSAVPWSYFRNSSIHPATRVFQALRITVNDELNSLARGLEAAWTILEPGGRMAVISFHSLEDRIVKHQFKDFKKSSNKSIILTKKPLRPGNDEIRTNARARSAKLRVIQK